jgi:hypothetical protein
MSLSGGLAQLVEQRTLNNCKFYRALPCKPITATFLATSGWSFSDNTPQHTEHKKITAMSGFFYLLSAEMTLNRYYHTSRYKRLSAFLMRHLRFKTKDNKYIHIS